jgi:hypothetical protein
MTLSGRRVGIATIGVGRQFDNDRARLGKQLIDHFVSANQQGRWHT